MYEDLEPIARLKYTDVVESLSADVQAKLSEAIVTFGARGLVHSGPMEAEKLKIRLNASERMCRAEYEIWLDLITRRSNGRITREDIDFIIGKIERSAAQRVANVRTAQSGGVVTPDWAAQQAEVKMHAITAAIRRELEIKHREQEAFPQSPTPQPAQENQSEQTRLDPLLNIPDKGAFNRDFDVLCRRASAQNPVSMILADIDHFKIVNDSYGYQTGDQVLKEVAQAFTRMCANKATVYRWGGEEFAVLLDNYSLAEAEALAERMRSHLAEIVRDGNPRAITASFGVSTSPEVTPEASGLFQAANQAIQVAKRSGRNQVRATTPQKAAKGKTPLTQHALSIFMRTDESVRKLDEEIASASGQPFERTIDASFNVAEKAKALEVTTVDEVAELVRKSGDTIRKVAGCFVHTTPVPVGYCVSIALDVAAALRGNDACHAYFGSLKLTTTPVSYINDFMETLALLDAAK